MPRFELSDEALVIFVGLHHEVSILHHEPDLDMSWLDLSTREDEVLRDLHLSKELDQ